MPEEIRSQSYIKRPKLLCLDNEDEAKLLPQLLLGEAEMLQFLGQNPHLDIIRFHGCTVNRGRFTDITLQKHSIMLKYCHEDVPRPFDIDTCMRGIRAALTHLHSLGFAHNDVNPTNIAIDCDDNPKLLDFGSCGRFGKNSFQRGHMDG
jgi:serine/threonine protein kinase